MIRNHRPDLWLLQAICDSRRNSTSLTLRFIYLQWLALSRTNLTRLDRLHTSRKEVPRLFIKKTKTTLEMIQSVKLRIPPCRTRGKRKARL